MNSNSIAPVKKTKSKGSTQNGDEFNEIQHLTNKPAKGPT